MGTGTEMNEGILASSSDGLCFLPVLFISLRMRWEREHNPSGQNSSLLDHAGLGSDLLGYIH